MRLKEQASTLVQLQRCDDNGLGPAGGVFEIAPPVSFHVPCVAPAWAWGFCRRLGSASALLS